MRLDHLLSKEQLAGRCVFMGVGLWVCGGWSRLTPGTSVPGVVLMGGTLTVRLAFAGRMLSTADLTARGGCCWCLRVLVVGQGRCVVVGVGSGALLSSEGTGRVLWRCGLHESSGRVALVAGVARVVLWR